jgi:hypothetical protein
MLSDRHGAVVSVGEADIDDDKPSGKTRRLKGVPYGS